MLTVVGAGRCTGSNSTVRLSVKAGGGPYGRVMWMSNEYVTSRPPQTAALTTLYLTRSDGSRGRLRVFYRYWQASFTTNGRRTATTKYVQV